MSNSQTNTGPEHIRLDASSIGASKVQRGPTRDVLDDIETATFLEAALKCELLRAEIDKTTREGELKSFAIQRSFTWVSCALLFVGVVLGWQMLDPEHGRLQPQHIVALTFVLGLTLNTARNAVERLQ